MTNLTKQSITSAFIGKAINFVNLERCTWCKISADGHYTVDSSGFLYDNILIERFGVTKKLKELWERR